MVLPGGIPRGGSKQEGSDPTNTEDQVATELNLVIKIIQITKPDTPKKKKITFQSLSYPDGLDNTEEFPHQIMFNVLIKTVQMESSG